MFTPRTMDGPRWTMNIMGNQGSAMCAEKMDIYQNKFV